MRQKTGFLKTRDSYFRPKTGGPKQWGKKLVFEAKDWIFSGQKLIYRAKNLNLRLNYGD